MKVNKNVFSAVAISMALGVTGFVGTANAAAITSTFAAITALNFATDRVAKTQVKAANIVNTLPATATLAAFKAGDEVVITLVGGAKFNGLDLATAEGGAPFNGLVSATGDIGSAAVAMAFASVGTLDATQKIYTKALHATDISSNGGASTDTTTLAAVTVFNKITVDLSTAGVLDLTGVAAGSKVTATVEVFRTAAGTRTKIFSGTTTSANSSLDVFATHVNTVATAVAAADKTISVGKAYKEFTSGTTSTSNAVSLPAGDALSGTSTGYHLITVSGPMAGVGSIISGSGTITDVTSANAAPAGGSTAATNDFFIDTAANKAYASVGAGTTAINLGTITLEVDAATVLADASAYTVQVDYVAGTADKFTAGVALAPTTLSTWNRDGVDFQMNLVTASDSLVITNNNVLASALTITAKDVAGAATGAAAAGAAALPTTIAGGATITISGADLIANFPSAGYYNVVAESTNVNAQLIHIVPGVGASTSVLRTASTGGGL